MGKVTAEQIEVGKTNPVKLLPTFITGNLLSWDTSIMECKQYTGSSTEISRFTIRYVLEIFWKKFGESGKSLEVKVLVSNAWFGKRVQQILHFTNFILF